METDGKMAHAGMAKGMMPIAYKNLAIFYKTNVRRL